MRARRLISEADDRQIVDQVVRDAKGNDPNARALYFRYLRPAQPRTAANFEPIDIGEPTSAREALDMIGKVTAMIARGEVDAEHGSRVIAGLREYRDGRAAELEALYERDKMLRGGGE